MSTEIRKSKDTIQVRNETFEVVSDFRFDIETGDKVSDNILDNIAIQKAFKMYRKKYNVLSKDEIKNIRKKYAISQRDFATLTGIGVATIARYETGQIPTNSNNELIKSLGDDFRIAQDLFIQNGTQLSSKVQKKLNDKIETFIKDNSAMEVFNFAEKRLSSEGPSINTGYKIFEFEKFRNMVLYFAKEINYLSKTKLNKLLFYSDFKCFQQELVSMTGLSYKRDYYGPVPMDFEILYSILNDLDNIMWHIFPNGKGEYIVHKESFNADVFTKEELQIMEEVVQKFGEDNAEKISDKSHEEIGYIETEMKNVISYEYANHLKYI